MTINNYKLKKQISQKHLLSLVKYSREEIFEIIKYAAELKYLLKKGKTISPLKNKTVALIFAKSSTRTRVSFEQGVRQLGGYPMFLSSNDIQLGRGEPISDTVKTLERYNIDAIMIRTFNQSDLVELAEKGTIPIINGLTDDFHPCQALADLLTIYEHFGRLDNLKLAFFGDGNNVANSLMIAGAKAGLEVVVCTPKANAPQKEILELAKSFGNVSITDDVVEAADKANIIYTDVFLSMGQESDLKKKKSLMVYQVNSDIMEYADKNAIFMHCLPAKRGEEVTAEVIDGVQSVVFEQAENRLHAQKAVMALLMGEK